MRVVKVIQKVLVFEVLFIIGMTKTLYSINPVSKIAQFNSCVSCEYLTRLTRQCLTCKSLQAHIHIVKVWFPHKQHRQWLLIGHHYEVLSPEANTQQSCNFATAREVSTLFTRDNFVRAQNTLNIFSFAKLWFTLLSYGLLCYLNLIVRPCPLGPLV